MTDQPTNNEPRAFASWLIEQAGGRTHDELGDVNDVRKAS